MISNQIEIITNLIEINVIYRGEVVSNSNGCINPRDYIDLNYICKDFNSITIRFQLDFSRFQLDFSRFQLDFSQFQMISVDFK